MGAKLSGGAGGGGRFDSMEANSEINVTPFVDIMLVLLIIFMVAAPMAAASIEVELPPAVAKASPNPPKPVYISIQPDGGTFIGDGSVPVEEIGKTLKDQMGRRDPSKERIFIRADKQVAYRDFMEVMNQLQDFGFYSVALIGADNNK